jgi:hypothetical protein
LRDIPLPSFFTLNAQMHIEKEEFPDVWFKQHAVIEFLTMGKIRTIEIHRQM